LAYGTHRQKLELTQGQQVQLQDGFDVHRF
jgi:hypothetical protein